MQKIRTHLIVGITAIFLFISPALFSQPDETALFREAEKRFQTGDYELAANLYLRLVEQFPYSRRVGESYYRYAVSKYKLGEYAEALAGFREVEGKFPQMRFTAAVPFWTGSIYYRLGRFEEAERAFVRYLESGNRQEFTKKAFLYLGVSRAKLDKNEEAIDTLEKALGFIDPEMPSSAENAYLLVLLLSLYAETFRFERILEYGETADFSGMPPPYRQKARLYLAEAFWRQEKKERAEKLYLKLIEEPAPGEADVVPFKRLFSLYRDRGEGEKLEDLVRQAELRLVNQTGVLAEFWTLIGVEYYAEEKYEIAESYLSRVWRMRDRVKITELVPLYLSELYADRGEYEEGVSLIETFMEKNERRSEKVLARLGTFYVRLKNWKKTEAVYGELAARFPGSENYAQYIYFLALSYHRRGQNNKAEELLAQELSLGKGVPYTGKILRLRSVVEMELGMREEAIETLREYIPLKPEDLSARYDLIRLYFHEKRYQTVIFEIQKLYEQHPMLGEENPAMDVLFRYMLGLSVIPGKEYSRGAGILKEVAAKAEEYVPEVHPYLLFYQGWARYRNGEYTAAFRLFDEFLKKYPEHPLAERGRYTAGWCAYTEENYARAAELFSRFFEEDADPGLQPVGILMYGKSSVHRKNYGDAAFAFEYIFTNFPGAEYADDALFEYGKVLYRQERFEKSMEIFSRLHREYPESGLAEEGMYMRGELAYREEDYVRARNAFYDYRVLYPEGRLVDVSLYWGGMAYKASGEPFGAVLLWERLVETYPDSSFRPDAMAETAAIYADSGNYQKALSLYNQLIHQYPVEAASVNAEKEKERLLGLLEGMYGREAELNAVINRENGAETEAGRDALLELSRFYIYRDIRESELERARTMLKLVLEKQEEDPEAAAHAMYLLGEYFYRKGDLEEAGKSFIRAATMYSRDRDFMASAMYRAAEMTKLAGNLEEAERLIRRIAENFPDSQWLLEGKKLLEEER